MSDDVTSGQAAYENSTPAREVPTGQEAERVVSKLVYELACSGIEADELAGADWGEMLASIGEPSYEFSAAQEAQVVERLRGVEISE